MWRAKAACCTVILLLLTMLDTAFAADKLYTAEYTEYYEDRSYNAYLRYPKKTELYFSEGEDAHLVSLSVKKGDAVKEGDVIAVFTVRSDRASVLAARNELENAGLAKSRTVCEDLFILAQRGYSIATAAGKAKKEQAEYDRDIFCLKMEKDLADRDMALEDAGERLEDSLRFEGEIELKAPSDGIVEHVCTILPGGEVSPRDLICTLYDPAVKLLEVEDKDDIARYGTQVKVYFYDGKNTVETTGRVVSAANALPDGRATKMAYVAYDEPEGKYPLNYISVDFVYIYEREVLSVPFEALSMENGKYYLYILSPEGTRQKRFVNVVSHPMKEAWVIQGIEAGDRIIW